MGGGSAGNGLSTANPRRNEWSYRGPFFHGVGDRSEAGWMYASISQLHYLLAWAIDQRRQGRIPVKGSRPHDDVHYPVFLVARLQPVYVPFPFAWSSAGRVCG